MSYILTAKYIRCFLNVETNIVLYNIQIHRHPKLSIF